MEIRLLDGLPYVEVCLTHAGAELELTTVLLDTGSLGTLFSADRLLEMNLRYEIRDRVHRIRGVGGTEFVFSKRVDRMTIQSLWVEDFDIQIGAMDYGMEMDGILGMDFLIRVGAVIDLAELSLSRGAPGPV